MYLLEQYTSQALKVWHDIQVVWLKIQECQSGQAMMIDSANPQNIQTPQSGQPANVKIKALLNFLWGLFVLYVQEYMHQDFCPRHHTRHASARLVREHCISELLLQNIATVKQHSTGSNIQYDAKDWLNCRMDGMTPASCIQCKWSVSYIKQLATGKRQLCLMHGALYLFCLKFRLLT